MKYIALKQLKRNIIAKKRAIVCGVFCFSLLFSQLSFGFISAESLLQAFGFISTESTQQNRRQGLIMNKMEIYLKNKYTEAMLANRNETSIQISPYVMGGYSRGKCFGLSFLWLYSKWLETQPNAVDKLREDYSWFKSLPQSISKWKKGEEHSPSGPYFGAEYDESQWINKDYGLFSSMIDLILNWDKKSMLTDEEEEKIEASIALLHFFHGGAATKLSLGRLEVDKILEQTGGRRFTNEYSIQFSASFDQLIRVLGVKDFIQDKKPIFIVAHVNGADFDAEHATALFKDGEYYCYYDANSPYGEIRTRSLVLLTYFIFESFNFSYKKRNTIYFGIFSFDQEFTTAYPPPRTILNVIAANPPLIDYLPQSSLDPWTLSGSEKLSLYAYDLHQAISHDCFSCAKYYSKKGHKLWTLSDKEFAHVVLSKAIFNNKINFIELFLKDGADINIVDSFMRTPLHVALEYKSDVDTIKFLLDNGADPNIRSIECGASNFNVIRSILAHRANSRNIVCGANSVTYAVRYHPNPEVFDILLKYGGQVQMFDKDGTSMLMHAASANNLVLVNRFLDEYKIDPNVQNDRGYTALINSIRENSADQNRLEVINTLLVNGAQSNIQDKDGYTVLMYAANNGDLEAASIFLQNGADPHIRNNEGKTALTIAIEMGHYRVAEAINEKFDQSFFQLFQ